MKHPGFRSSRTFLALALASAIPLAACNQRAPDATTTTTAGATAASASTTSVADRPVYVCPMDKDIRAHDPGSCPRCGMKLVTTVPDPVEYHVELTATPAPQANRPVHLTFEVLDPWKNNRVTKFSVVHEKLFHAFIVSRDLQFFQHYHPAWGEGTFAHDVTLPKTGMYRILADFYPEASAPQLVTKTLFVAGADPPAPPLAKDYAGKRAENLSVEMAATPEEPFAGEPAQLRLTIAPAEGLEKYLGAWAHMLAASDDLVDMLHTHPTLADGSAQMLFTVVFPRARTYRVWLQLQRNGIVNTAHFDVPVRPQPAEPVAFAAPKRVKSRGSS